MPENLCYHLYASGVEAGTVVDFLRRKFFPVIHHHKDTAVQEAHFPTTLSSVRFNLSSRSFSTTGTSYLPRIIPTYS